MQRTKTGLQTGFPNFQLRPALVKKPVSDRLYLVRATPLAQGAD